MRKLPDGYTIVPSPFDGDGRFIQTPSGMLIPNQGSLAGGDPLLSATMFRSATDEQLIDDFWYGVDVAGLPIEVETELLGDDDLTAMDPAKEVR